MNIALGKGGDRVKKQSYSAIRTFFSDYLSWIIILCVLFVITLVSVIATGNAKGFIWLVPVMFLLIFSFSFRLLILYCKAWKDLKNNNIETLTIHISDIQRDDTYIFRHRGGGSVGKLKYKLTDKNGNFYLLSAANEKDMFVLFRPHPTFDLEIEVLKKSRLVLRMKIIDVPRTKKDARKPNYNITQFKKVFGHYL